MRLPEIETVLADRLAAGRGLDRDATLQELGPDAQIDSMEGLELALAAEEAFGITFSDDELSAPICRSVPALVRAVRAKLTQPSETQEVAR